MELYGLLGLTLQHSFSHSYFNDKFSRENIDAKYVNFEIPQIEDVLDVFRNHPNLRGMNVTIPYKREIIPYLTELNDDAREIGAVNVVKILHDDNKCNDKNGLPIKLIGYNTDYLGFTQSIKPLLQEKHKKALILGTGGASQAVEYGLRKLGISCQKVSRRKSDNCISYDDLTSEVMAEHTVIVNTTPLGTSPNVDECPDIPYDTLTSEHLLYDLIYNPSETLFLKKGKEHGCVIKNGLEMLQIQADWSWKIWNM